MAEIDPNYAAQFQRGFDPALHETPSVRRRPARLAGGPLPTAERVPEPPRMSSEPEIIESAEGTPAPPEHEVDEPSAPIPLTWWDWVLPGLGVALVITSLALWWGLATDPRAFFGAGASDRWTLFVYYARSELAGPLLMTGVLAVTGGLVLQAVRPRR